MLRQGTPVLLLWQHGHESLGPRLPADVEDCCQSKLNKVLLVRGPGVTCNEKTSFRNTQFVDCVSICWGDSWPVTCQCALFSY